MTVLTPATVDAEADGENALSLLLPNEDTGERRVAYKARPLTIEPSEIEELEVRRGEDGKMIGAVRGRYPVVGPA